MLLRQRTAHAELGPPVRCLVQHVGRASSKASSAAAAVHRDRNSLRGPTARAPATSAASSTATRSLFYVLSPATAPAASSQRGSPRNCARMTNSTRAGHTGRSSVEVSKTCPSISVRDANEYPRHTALAPPALRQARARRARAPAPTGRRRRSLEPVAPTRGRPGAGPWSGPGAGPAPVGRRSPRPDAASGSRARRGGSRTARCWRQGHGQGDRRAGHRRQRQPRQHGSPAAVTGSNPHAPKRSPR